MAGEDFFLKKGLVCTKMSNIAGFLTGMKLRQSIGDAVRSMIIGC